MLDRAIGFVLRARWWGLALTLSVLAVACAGLLRLQITADSRVFIGPHNPYRLVFEEFEKTFSSSENVFVAVWVDEGNIFTPERLTAISNLTDQLWRVPYVLRAHSLTNFVRSTADGDTIVIEPLVKDPRTLDASAAAAIRDTALGDELLRNLVAPDGTMAGINLSINPDFPPDAPHRILAALDEMLQAFALGHPDLRLGVTGSIAMARAYYEATWSDVKTLIPVSLACMLALMALMLRSLALSVVVYIQVVLCALAAMGMAGWFGIVLNPASVNAGIIVAVLLIAHNVYLVTAVQAEQKGSVAQSEAVGRAVRRNIIPVFLSGLTTALGVLSFNACDAPPFRDLGNITAVGLLIGFLSWCTLMPALLMRLPLPARRRGPIFPMIEPVMAEFVIRNRKALVAGGLVIALALCSGLVNLRLINNFIKDFDERFAFRRITEIVNERLDIRSGFEFVIDSGHPEDVFNPDFLGKVDAFCEWLRQQPDVVYVYSVTDILKRTNRDLNGGDPSDYVLPRTRDTAAQMLLLYELSLPAGLDLTDRIDIHKRKVRVSVGATGSDSVFVSDFEKRANEWMWEHRERDISLDITGLSVIYAHIAHVNTRSMLVGNAFAFSTVSIIMALLFRRMRVIALGLISNMLPPLVTLGIWGLMDGRVGMSVSVVIAMTFGIVVDDTIHSVLAYLGARNAVAGREDAIRHVFATVGRPIVVTTLILSLGFSVLVFSGHAVTANFGLISAMVISVAVLFDYLFLPAALLIFDRPHFRRATTPGPLDKSVCYKLGSGRSGSSR